ncbi:hypothetical protein KIW84_022371 [Lathyrus oleraceus]|uniref:Ribonuclease n=1 Tax=Pisum sativum TaxID=3888 RepID=A0A9D4YAE6_PEA|nr:hypothetical protein KIW84_022371 [Pisum sativum]
MGSEAMVPEWASEPCIMGIDEAGRGPVLGPMVYGCLYCPLSYKKTLATLSFADSKTLKEEKREELFEALKGNDSIGWAVDVIDPKELSAKMLKKNKINLNEISHDSAMGLVDRVLKIGVLLTEVYIDTVGDPGKYEAKMSKNFPSIKFVVAKKADSLYPVVSGASIAAKVTRDRAVRDWVLDETADNIHRNFGSGYPADPATKSWLENHKHSIFGFPTLPMEIYVDDEAKLTLHGLVQHYIKLKEEEKNRKLNDLLDALDFNQVVIFVKSVSRAAELDKLLIECNFPSICIHSGMSQEERLKRYRGFKEGHTRILVATDLVGRGIDI